MIKSISITLFYLLAFLSYVNITGCKTTDKEKAGDTGSTVPLQQLYWHTQVVNDAVSNEVSVLVQFYEDGITKKTMALPEGVTILLDGELFQADSSKKGGVFYEITKPLTDFAGTHELEIKTDTSTYTETFNFPGLPVAPAHAEPAEIIYHRNNFAINIAAVSKMDNVRIIVTDTSFPGKGFEMHAAAATDAITLQPSEVADIKNGPLVIEINGESGKALSGNYPGKGKIDITAVIRNEATLKD